MSHRAEPAPEVPDAYVAGYMRGVGEAGARLIGAVAAELGTDHPLVDRMVRRLGQLSPDRNDGLEVDDP